MADLLETGQYCPHLLDSIPINLPGNHRTAGQTHFLMMDYSAYPPEFALFLPIPENGQKLLGGNARLLGRIFVWGPASRKSRLKSGQDLFFNLTYLMFHPVGIAILYSVD